MTTLYFLGYMFWLVMGLAIYEKAYNKFINSGFGATFTFIGIFAWGLTPIFIAIDCGLLK